MKIVMRWAEAHHADRHVKTNREVLGSSVSVFFTTFSACVRVLNSFFRGMKCRGSRFQSRRVNQPAIFCLDLSGRARDTICHILSGMLSKHYVEQGDPGAQLTDATCLGQQLAQR